VSLFDRVKSALSQTASQIGQAGQEVQVEMRLDRVRRWVAATPPDITPQRIVDELQSILRTDSRVTPEAHRLLAEQLTEQGDIAGAISHLKSAASAMSTEVPVPTRDWIAEKLQLREDEYLRNIYLELAGLHQRQEDWEKALTIAELAIELDSHELTAYHTAIYSLLRMGQTDLAERMIRRAQTFDALGLVDGWAEEFVKSGLLPEE